MKRYTRCCQSQNDSGRYQNILIDGVHHKGFGLEFSHDENYIGVVVNIKFSTND